MHTLKIRINDSVYDKIQYFLNHLPKDDVEILSDDIEKSLSEKTMDFSQFKVKSFEKIEDPVKWQRSIRDEWDR